MKALWQFTDSGVEYVCVHAVWLCGAQGICSDGSECETCQSTHSHRTFEHNLKIASKYRENTPVSQNLRRRHSIRISFHHSSFEKVILVFNPSSLFSLYLFPLTCKLNVLMKPPHCWLEYQNLKLSTGTLCISLWWDQETLCSLTCFWQL